MDAIDQLDYSPGWWILTAPLRKGVQKEDAGLVRRG